MALSGDVRCLIQTNNGDIFAGVVGSAAIYKSTDDGVTWNHVISLGSVATDTVRAFAQPYNSSLIFAAVTATNANRGVWYSQDNGANWTPLISLSGGVTAITDDGAWDLDVHNLRLIIAFKDEHNGRDLYVNVYNTSSGSVDTLSSINVSITNSFAPHAIIRSRYSGSSNHYLATTNKFATQAYFLSITSSSETASLLSPTSSMGAHNSSNTGQRNLIQFNWWDPAGSLGVTTMLATYRSITPTGTEIWVINHTNISGPAPTTFTKISSINDTVRKIYADPDDIENYGYFPTYPEQRTVWGAGDGNLWVSYNKGYTWEIATDSPTEQLYAIVRTSAGTLIAAGDNAEVIRYTGTGGPGGGEPSGGEEEEPGGESGGGGSGTFTKNTAILGRESTSTGFVGVSNKSALANVTYVFNYDTSSYTYLQFNNNPPYTLFDATPGVGDIVYFGSRTSDPDVPSGPFSSLVFNLTQEAQGITGYIWEYWDGATWSTLDVTDNTNGFSELGENSVHWRHPSDWVTTTINSIEGYWVRIRITSVEASVTPPIHSERFIYTINLPWVEIPSTQVNGNVPSLVRLNWKDQSDSGDSGTNPNLYVDRLLVGLRSLDRGSNFQVYLNASDEQNHFGISGSTGDFASFSDDINAPTTRKVCYSHISSGTLDAFLDHSIWTIDNTIARDFYGTYRAFVRCKRDSGTSTTWKLRVKVSFGSEGIPTYSKDAWIVSTEAFEVLDLGRIRIPNTEVISALDNIGDELTISVQGYCTTQGVTMCIYDLILIPTDEWAIDAIIPTTDTSLDNAVLGQEILDIDSITNPKREISSYARKSSGLIKTNYRSIANGPSILQTESTQRLWFFGMENRVTHWRAYPEIAGSVKLYKVQRYAAMRGFN